ncbi:uncharacterized protein FIBRA_01487 [Fibroporia radiculosa]|uniref:tyrosinase n=1 Tax=Fibroporia radiculosa TaxID=599839 RepID=J4H162_9APHY|nr:uncharacterized protein FIBRA_01487 [Fibroporia radiculosa]CCL99469.1 predicted protein [Fibroporia radiculosa]
MSKATDPRPTVTGVPRLGLESVRGERRNYNDWTTSSKLVSSLYVQALQRMMSEPYADDFSWESIGGIHGLPYVRWGDSGGPNPDPDSEFGGYCTHGSVLFPTWHRPYVALFEQAVQKQAAQIAQEYTTDRQEWIREATDLRSWFWDWAAEPRVPGMPVPELLISPKTEVITPKGVVTANNPLYSHVFQHPFPVSTFPKPFSSWKQTLRYPTSGDSSAESDMKKFVSNYAANASQIRTQTYHCLTRLTTWEKFSNHTAKNDPTIANSLETIHDQMHVIIGGISPYPGHMADPTVAGFDVAFFAHHTNVDRLLALWRAINYTAWVSPGQQPDGTYTLSNSAEVDTQSDLTPFWRNQEGYWKSADIIDTNTFNYAYEDFKGTSQDPAVLAKQILLRVQALYGGDSIALAKKHASNGSIREWNVHIKFKKFELGSSFSVLVYIGETYVGSVSAFVNSRPENCANCRRNQDVEVEGFVHLTKAMVEKYTLPSLEPDDVRPILAEHISVKLEGFKPDGTPANISDDLPSLKVAVCSQLVSYGRGDEQPRPTLGDVNYHHDIFEGKPGHVPAGQW